MSLAIPLLEEASLIDSDELQNRWAALVANAADASRPPVPRAFVSILADLAPEDTPILQAIFEADRDFAPSANMPEAELWTHRLPDAAVVLGSLQNHQERGAVELPREVELSLGNLARLGLIRSAMAWGGKGQFSAVSITELGRQFMAACRAE